MMAGRFKEYTWKDILQLIFKDSGLETESSQRTMGEMRFRTNFTPPEYDNDTVIVVQVYDEDFSTRIKKHAEGETK